MSFQIQVDQGAAWVVEQLEKAGYEAYVVGGCVRDALMGITPKDWDITTSARPEQVKEVFPVTFDTGIEHGTVSVRHEHETYEVTTYRIDGAYTDHRRPTEVAFTSKLYEDLARRDFTINAMAYHPERGLIDYFEGQRDLKEGCIRCVGRAEERFEEDALRMLRAIRFAARLQFTIEPQTFAAIQIKAEGLAHVSRERVADEMNKTLLCENPQGLSQIVSSGLYPYVCAQFQNEWQEKATATVDFEAPAKVLCQKALRWAALLYPLGSEKAGKVLRELKFDNATHRDAVHLVQYREAALPQNGRDMRFFLNRLGTEYYEALCSLKNATHRESKEQLSSGWTIFEAEKHQCVTLHQLSVSGRDLIGAGAQTGKALGNALSQLLDLVMEQPEMNEKEKLLQYFRENLLA